MSKIKIAFFLDVMEENFDGVAITMHQVINRIPKEEFDVIFITPHPPKNDIGFPVFEVPYFRVPEKNKDYRFGLPKKRKDLNEILDAFNPDILHYSSPTAMGKFAVRYAKAKGKIVTSIYHTHYPSFLKYYFGPFSSLVEPIFHWLYAMYPKTDKILAPTKSMSNYLKSIGIKQESLTIWGRGVDTDRFNPSKKAQDLWEKVPKGNIKLLFVSRLTREKEPQTLIRLYKLIQKKNAPISMILVGDGPMRQMLQEKMPEAIFMGPQYGEELSKAYASADVFVFPSTTETFGNVVLEALASGLPVVAANAGGPSDIVSDGQNGFLVEPANEQAFFDKIMKLVQSEELSRQMSSTAREYAKSQSWEKLSEQLFDQYRRLVKR